MPRRNSNGRRKSRPTHPPRWQRIVTYSLIRRLNLERGYRVSPNGGCYAIPASLP